jgi:predicted Fe-Mo cluster-binding NifX family protein
MKIAIPVWNEHVSPILDVARRVRVYDIVDTSVQHTSVAEIAPGNHARVLRDHEVEVLICAGISARLESLLWVFGITVIADVCGPIERIAAAYAAGDTALSRFRSPGVSRHHHGEHRDGAPNPVEHRERNMP